MILNVSNSIGYPFRSGFGSDNIYNQKYQKKGPFGIYVGFGLVQIYFYRIGFGSNFRIRFEFSDSVYLSSPNRSYSVNKTCGFSACKYFPLVYTSRIILLF